MGHLSIKILTKKKKKKKKMWYTQKKKLPLVVKIFWHKNIGQQLQHIKIARLRISFQTFLYGVVFKRRGSFSPYLF